MGIYKFNNWLKDTYPQCINKQKKGHYNHLYIDLNFLLHLSVYRSNCEHDFMINLYCSLDTILCNYSALNTVTIAIDGPSPYSKINLQRKRRLQSSDNVDVTKLNSLHLTPGTNFMVNLTNHIKTYIQTRQKWFKYRKTQFILFPTNIPGEGEIKLLKQLIDNSKLVHNTKSSQSHLVIGNDADLVVMTMGLMNVDNIFVLIKTKTGYDIVCTRTLLQGITKYINDTIDISPSINPIKQDFVILSIMMGNDYLPKLGCCNFNSVWLAYKKTQNNLDNFLINDNKFNKEFLIEFLNNIALAMPKQFQTLSIKKYTQFGEDKLKSYLEGLLWCLQMYSTGICHMYNYECSCTYSPSPLFLLYYIQTTNDVITAPTSTITPLNVDTCAILLLPKKAQPLISNKYHKLMNTQLKKYYEMEECKICHQFKSKIKTLNKKINDLKEKNMKHAPESNRIMRYNDEYNNHRLIHVNDFTVDKIRKIVENFENNII